MTLWEREGDVLVAEDGRKRPAEDFEPSRVAEFDDEHPYAKRYPDGTLGLDHDGISDAIRRGATVNDILLGR